MRIDTADLYTVVRESDIEKSIISKLPMDVFTEYEEARKTRMYGDDIVITVNQCIEYIKAHCYMYPNRKDNNG